MKTDKIVLSALGLGVCIWSATMIVGVAGLARTQGPGAWWALLEVAAFAGAGLLPLLLVWNPDTQHKQMLVAIWAVCLAYVSLLALNLLRLGHFTMAGLRLGLWIAIAVLLIRALRRPRKPTRPGA